MSLLSSFIINNIIKALEAEFLSHMPELQQAFLDEVSVLVKEISDWVESKLSNKGKQIMKKAKKVNKLSEKNIRNMSEKEPKMEKKKSEHMKKKRK